MTSGRVRWVFAPTVWPTLAAVFFLTLTLWLGHWQSERADFKRGLQAQYDRAANAPVVAVDAALVAREALLHRRVEVSGRFDDRHTLFLDNRIHDGVAGYHVLTPLRLEGGRTAILVNRGWVAVGRSRERLPLVPPPQGVVRLTGLAVDPASRYVELDARTTHGRLWQNLDFARFASQYPTPLQPVLLLQTSDTGDGLVREWPRPDAGVDMHTSYAFQWYSLAATLVVLWVGLNVRRRRDDADETSGVGNN